MSLKIDANVLFFKQGNKINEWWIASRIDVEYIEKLINTILKVPDKKHKLQYINQKNELTYVEGYLNPCEKITFDKFNIIFYSSNYKNIIRQIIVITLPKHNGISNDSYSDKESTSPKSNS